MKVLASVLSLALLAGISTVSIASAEDCGCGGYTPPKVHKIKSNAGVGNGSEVNEDFTGPTEDGDVDPGNSFANNQAAKNVGKPNSPRAGDVNIIP